MAEDNLITAAGLVRIQHEIEFLRTVERPRIVAEVSYAASLGDRSENAEYIFGKKRLREIDSRVTFLVRCLNRVKVIDPGQIRSDIVRFGATVSLEDEDGQTRTWRIYGVHESDVSAGIISHKSPIGASLMGKRVGDDVMVRTPGGERWFSVLEVRYEAQAPVPEPSWRQDRAPGPTAIEEG